MSEAEQIAWLADIVGKLGSAQRSLTKMGEEDTGLNKSLDFWTRNLDSLRQKRKAGVLQ